MYIANQNLILHAQQLCHAQSGPLPHNLPVDFFDVNLEGVLFGKLHTFQQLPLLAAMHFPHGQTHTLTQATGKFSCGALAGGLQWG